MNDIPMLKGKSDPIHGMVRFTKGDPAMTTDLPKKRFTPLGNLVALKVNKATQSPGGIQLPDSLAESGTVESVTAWVVAVGPDCKQLKRGDLVLAFLATPATKVTYKGEKLVVLEEGTICGVIDPEEYQ